MSGRVLRAARALAIGIAGYWLLEGGIALLDDHRPTGVCVLIAAGFYAGLNVGRTYAPQATGDRPVSATTTQPRTGRTSDHRAAGDGATTDDRGED